MEICSSSGWMFLSTFEKLRIKIYKESQLLSVNHLGMEAFDLAVSLRVAGCLFRSICGDIAPFDRNSCHSQTGRVKTSAADENPLRTHG